MENNNCYSDPSVRLHICALNCHKCDRTEPIHHDNSTSVTVIDSDNGEAFWGAQT